MPIKKAIQNWIAFLYFVNTLNYSTLNVIGKV